VTSSKAMWKVIGSPCAAILTVSSASVSISLPGVRAPNTMFWAPASTALRVSVSIILSS